MSKQKSTARYSHPFCAGYWRDALAELKDTKMLVFAAMIVVMRVALKTIIRIPLGPSLDITPAFMANALGAMVYGPVVGAIGAIVSDVLGVVLRGDTYFLPYVLTEISGTVIFALFFYRQKITPTKVILATRYVETLSDGECQRVMIARALAQDTPAILLDEPTSYLDMPNRYELCTLLGRLAHDEGKCVIFSTHELDIALTLADNIALVDTPHLRCMPTAEMVASGNIERLFDSPYVAFDAATRSIHLK